MSGTSAIVEPATAYGRSVRYVARLQRLAVGIAIAAIAQCIGIILISAAGDKRFPISLDLVTIGFLGSVILFPVMGALIIQRRPLTRVAWLMIATGVGLGFGLLMFGYGTTGMPPAPPRPLALEALVLSQLFFLPSIATGAVLLLLLFPTDRLLEPRWQIAVVIAAVGVVLYDLGTLFHGGAMDEGRFPGLQNPLGAPAAWAPLVHLMAALGNILVTVAALLGALSLVVRYRRADVVEAAQIRWIALLASLAAIAFAISAIPIEPESEVAFGIGLVLLSGMPIAIGIAITRYHLFDIDRLINRTLVYGSLTAILAGVFTAAIGLAQRVFIAVTGEKSDAAIVLTTLFVATLYAPLRKRLEAVVDRRFRYDERRFGAYRDEVKRILTVLQPSRAAERLVIEAVRELAATGGVVMDAEDRPTASAGEWPVRPAVRVAIPGGGGPLAAILVGPRVDGRPHDPRSIAELQEIATLVAVAARVNRDHHRQGGRVPAQDADSQD
jgi:hypothetical protein